MLELEGSLIKLFDSGMRKLILQRLEHFIKITSLRISLNVHRTILSLPNELGNSNFERFQIR